MKSPKRKKVQSTSEIYSQPVVARAESKEEILPSEEEKQQAKLQKEIMKKYYRNRYSTFLQALANKKVEATKEAELKE